MADQDKVNKQTNKVILDLLTVACACSTLWFTSVINFYILNIFKHKCFVSELSLGIFHLFLKRENLTQHRGCSCYTVWFISKEAHTKRVVNSCPKYDLDRKETLLQEMTKSGRRGDSFFPPWANIALDFAGPYVVKGEVNRRARMKILIFIYCCLATGTGCLLAFPGFSTSDFLCQHAGFVYRKWQPLTMVSVKRAVSL